MDLVPLFWLLYGVLGRMFELHFLVRVNANGMSHVTPMPEIDNAKCNAELSERLGVDTRH